MLDSNARVTHFTTQPTTSKDEIREMMAVWPDVVRDLTDVVKHLDISDIDQWMAKVLQYNVSGGGKSRSLLLINSYKLLAPSDQLTKDNIRLIHILAWCIEMIQSYMIIFDDIQDRSLFRRKQPCWYRYNDIGLAAMNDGLMLENAVYYLIRKYFKEKECYINLVEIFGNSVMKIIIGQYLDLFSTNFGKKPNLDLFIMDRYSSIVKYKASSYTYILPVFTAMHCVGMKDPEMFRQAETILSEMGHFFQVQDDYLGEYGDPETIGKDNTDIKEGKCTWLIVTALQRATPMQRQILEECYGVSDPEKVRRVKEIYDDLDLPKTYSIYEEEEYNLLNTHIEQISCGIPQSLFHYPLEKMYRRVL